MLKSVQPLEATEAHLGTLHLVLRGKVQERLRRLFGSWSPLAEALVLARKEALDPDLREAFAVAGVAHLLAISGFHVGVVAGLFFSLLRLASVSRSRAALLASVGCWVYVLGIGVPHAAARAATILTFLAVGRARGRSVAPAGALATALILLVLLDPGSILAPGFQLSFAGAGGLVFLRPELARALKGGPLTRLPGWLRSGLASGVAATLATLPLVAWHFDRISLVGIPATLALTPLIALAIPGIGVSLLLSWILEPVGRFVAGGVGVVLAVTAKGAQLFAAVPGAALWVPRTYLIWGAAGCSLALFLLMRARRVRGSVRRGALLAAAASGVLAGPILAGLGGGGVLEMVFLDVGQGDAMALRSPGGRWLVVDAGPAADAYDAGERVVAPYLRRRGARRVEALVLTHPDLDHIGGAGAVLDALPVGVVADPGLPAGKSAYVDLLARARQGSVRWWRARAGEELIMDGVTVRVLHPFPGREEESADVNDLSVVLLVSFGAFRALLTGDASVAVEDAVLRRTPPGDVDLLKVGHHGSSTSTGEPLLEHTRPEAAVISAGRRNRYGHPHRSVVERLGRHGVRVLRTDRQGTVVVRARADGTWVVESG